MARLIIAAALLLGSAGYAAAQFFPLGLHQTISGGAGPTLHPYGSAPFGSVSYGG
jgi:hypothetical protein